MSIFSVELRLRELDVLVGALARIVQPPGDATKVRTKSPKKRAAHDQPSPCTRW
jgi:hypothetical protein